MPEAFVPASELWDVHEREARPYDWDSHALEGEPGDRGPGGGASDE